jgi:sugar-specific transcriptional regulator TrmB/DNA-binding CsgD family transcriptional regulator
VALEILGLDGLSESVYRAMLANPDADLDALAVSLAVPSTDVREALEKLVELSLVTERAPGRVYVPINPDVALDALLSLEQAEISRRERQLLEARAELSRLVRNSQEGVTPVREVRRIDGRDRVLEVMRELSARCYQETLNVLPGPPTPAELLADAAEHDLALVRRGVRLRTLHTRAQLADEPMLEYVRMIRQHGADVRIADTLPHRLVIFDRTVSFLPVDPRRPGNGALVVREPAITANLVMLFESLWAGAAELEEAVAAGAPAASELDRSVLMLMSSGVKDEAAARQLGISDRTYRRHVADILIRLGASSRFQAGVEAVRRGWL